MSKTARMAHSPRMGLPDRFLRDQALASRISGGDRSAFDEMFRRYHQQIYRFCSAMVGPEEGKDMLQNVMTKAMTSMPHDEDFQMKPWLYRVARNECVDHIRSARRTDSGLEADGQVDDSSRADPHQSAVDREQLNQLVNDLNGLPEKQRATLVMREPRDHRPAPLPRPQLPGDRRFARILRSRCEADRLRGPPLPRAGGTRPEAGLRRRERTDLGTGSPEAPGTSDQVPHAALSGLHRF